MILKTKGLYNNYYTINAESPIKQHFDQSKKLMLWTSLTLIVTNNIIMI